MKNSAIYTLTHVISTIYIIYSRLDYLPLWSLLYQVRASAKISAEGVGAPREFYSQLDYNSYQT